MAKIFDWSIQNGAICICFFVKWLILLRVTFQAYKSSTFPRQHHTLKSSTVWILSLVVRWRTIPRGWSLNTGSTLVFLWYPNLETDSCVSSTILYLVVVIKESTKAKIPTLLYIKKKVSDESLPRWSVLKSY